MKFIVAKRLAPPMEGDDMVYSRPIGRNTQKCGVLRISSFFNIPVAEAMQKLQSGVSGEIEPLVLAA